MLRRIVVVASVTCGLLLSSMSLPTSAVEPQQISTPKITRKIYAKVSAKKVLVGKKFVLSGKISPARKNVVVKRQRKVDGAWVNLPNGSVKTNAKGVWKMVIVAPSTPGQLNYKIYTPKITSIKAVTRSIKVVAAPKPVDPVDPVDPVEPPVIAPVLKIAAFPELHPAGSLTNVWGTYENLTEIDTLQIEQLIATDWVVLSAPITRFQKEFISSWKARITVPLTAGMHQFRLVSQVGEVRTASTPVSISVTGPELNFIDRLGPGSPSRIWGMDVARYQHETADGVGRLIDYNKSYAAGMRFVFIKASDGYVNSSGVMTGDNRAKRWLPGDRAGAQAAGMFTGFYHFPGMVETNDKSLIIKDARGEAIQAAARLASLGGYNSMDLPYVLDMEEDDLPGSGISAVATAASISLWVKTWLEEMTLRTGRKPIIYSTANYISRTLLRSDPVWTQYDLWLARYPCKTNTAGKCVTTSHMDHMDIVNQGAHPGGVAVTPWGTGSNIDWDFWQYSSSAVGKNFGIQNGAQVDVNVFRGTSADLRAMTQITWIPSEGDYEVTNSEVTLETSFSNANADLPVTLTVSAKRSSNGAAAVSGNLKVTNAGSPISGIKIVTSGVGKWTVTLPASAIGTVWNLNMAFTDPFDFYADNTTDFTLEIPSTP